VCWQHFSGCTVKIRRPVARLECKAPCKRPVQTRGTSHESLTCTAACLTRPSSEVLPVPLGHADPFDQHIPAPWSCAYPLRAAQPEKVVPEGHLSPLWINTSSGLCVTALSAAAAYPRRACPKTCKSHDVSGIYPLADQQAPPPTWRKHLPCRD